MFSRVRRAFFWAYFEETKLRDNYAVKPEKKIQNRFFAGEEFPFLPVTGRTLYQFNAGTMNRRTKNVELLPTDFLHISPLDAKRLKISNGETVKVKSRYCEIKLPARISEQVNTGELFEIFHDPKVFLNRLTSNHRDRFAQTPEFKVTAVKIEKIESK